MSKWILPLSMCLAAAGTAWAQAPQSAPADRGELRLEHLRVDLERRQVVVQAEVCLRQGLLELLLCKAGTKDYESILRTPARPSDIHAAMLALGLSPGLPVQRATRDGLAVVLPPRGPGLSVTLRWTDAQGQVRQADAASWLSARSCRAVPQEWVFVGSRVLPDGPYQADMDGDVISVSNFASSVIDVPFESTDANARLEFEANTDAIPPVGTAVEVTIQPLPGAQQSPYARAMVEVYSDGQLLADGQPMAGEALEAWARRLAAAHAQAQVTVRAAGSAPVQHVWQVRRALAEAGVADVREEVIPAAPVWLLRSPADIQGRLTWWRGRFAQASELVRDPADQARAELEDIQRRRSELARLGDLLEQYSRKLGQQVQQHQAASQPAEGP